MSGSRRTTILRAMRGAAGEKPRCLLAQQARTTAACADRVTSRLTARDASRCNPPPTRTPARRSPHA
jgi:hypothetical protein